MSHPSLYAFGSPEHLPWLKAQRAVLVSFYTPAVVDEGAGYYWLDADGRPLASKGAQLWLNARMLHCFSIESVLGNPRARAIAEHGVNYLLGAGLDARFGGWCSIVGGAAPDDRKELYGQAHVLLASSSALRANIARADELLELALANIERFWVEEDGRGIEAFDRSYAVAEDYRGQNANMHLTEALIATFDATGEERWLSRAERIARSIAGGAAEDRDGAWRLNEHFNSRWSPIPDHNVDDPRHAFRPYGSQPGHWLEWAKLLCQLRARGVEGAWTLSAAKRLFHGAFTDAWGPNGGFCYTVDWDGTPVVPEKYWWAEAEAIGAAAYLAELTGQREYADTYSLLWEWTDTHLIDRVKGGWFHELSVANAPTAFTWDGKPDLYHAYQATLYGFTTAASGFFTPHVVPSSV
ncbi:AGE family epimerase/isomerase [Actinomyces culturomici]|uniref:AGE family epimerase/isomerase n=1 Tax=Actinomyces culturomici TaxID=1926276 RepID=UPI000E1FF37B|nr:AGE family epimerase/isomerase [Actinomyces culturomici]